MAFAFRRLQRWAIGGSRNDSSSWAEGEHIPDSFFDLKCNDAKGNPFDLTTLRGKPVLVVNVASLCGKTTRWYSQLVKLAAQYGEKLEVLAFPCNQFLGQEPEDAEQVETCMRAKFDVNFRTMEKVLVNGPSTHAVYRFLRTKAAASDGDSEPGPIGWNFCMFLVSPDGARVQRFAASRTPLSITSEIDAEIGDKIGETPDAHTSAAAANKAT